jgi:flavodoxin
MDAVETGAADPGSTPEVDASAATETPSADVQAVSEADPNVEPNSTEGEGDEPEEWKKFLQSRGIKTFDKAAKASLGQNIYKTFNENSRFAKENEELRNRLQALEQAKPAEPEPTPEPPADLKELDEHITALKTDREGLDKREGQLNTAWFEADKAVTKLEAWLERADDLDKPALKAELAEAKANRRGIELELDRIPTTKRQHDALIKQAERDRANAERTHEYESRARQEAESKHKEWETGFSNQVSGFITQFANDLKVKEDPQTRELLTEVTNHAVMVALFKLGQAGISSVDVQGLVKSHVEKYAKAYDLIDRTKLNAASQQRQQVVKPVVTAKPGSTPRKFSSIEEELAYDREQRVKKLQSRAGL